MKKIIREKGRYILSWIFCSLLFLSCVPGYGQDTGPATRKISGKVVDLRGKGLAGVSISIKGTGKGTQTDEQGNFSISVSEKDVIVASYVGFSPVELATGSRGSFGRIVLEEKNSRYGDDIVVIGYGVSRRRDVTGAISSISGDEIRKTQPGTIDQALQGKVAGVIVQQVSGQPGGGVSVQIRGLSSFSNNPPLYVIDGVIIPPNAQSAIDGNGTNPLSSINPSEVETIDILKDASATAIYGSQATNGVVVITTRRGKSGKPTISYDGYFGRQKLPKYYDVMNLREYARFMNEKSAIIGYDLRPQFANPQYLGEGTNWQKVLFRTANMQNHTLGIAGGDERTKYYLAASYFSQDGIALGSGFKRTSVRLNLDNTTTDWLKIGTSLQLANVNENLGTSNNSNEVIKTALIQTPDVNATNPDGSYGGNPPNIYGAYSYNPYALALLRTDKKNRYQVFGNGYAEVIFTKDLVLRNEVSGNFDFATEDQFTPTINFGTSAITVNSATNTSAHNFYYSVRNFLTYSHYFNQPAIWMSLMGGHEGQLGKNDLLTASRTGFPSNNVTALSSGDALTAKNTGVKGQYAQESYYGRLNVTAKDRYLLTLNIRDDGSSKFSANGRWVTTYSGALAWRINKEAFFAGVPYVNDLKLRVGYGLTNNQNIRDYAYGSTLTTVTTALSGLSQLTATMGNPNVKWETTKSYDAGLDMSLLNGRIEFSGDYYNRRTDNLLLSLTLPLYSGTVDVTGYSPGSIQSPYVNIGSVNNKGYDLSLTTVNVKSKHFTWKTGYVLSHNENKVRSLNTEGASLPGYAGSTVVALTTVGHSIGDFYGYKADGLFTTGAELGSHALPVNSAGSPLPVTSGTGGIWLGDVKFRDLNKDNKIDAGDQTYLGSPRPKIQFGFNNSFSYRNFDLNIFFSGNLGNKVYNQVRVSGDNPNGNYGYFKSVMNYTKIAMIDASGSSTDPNNFKVSNPGTNIVRISQSSGNDNERFSTRYLENGSFARCKNITLGYTFSGDVLKKVRANSLRVYGTVTNVFTITKYTGYDPEIGSWNPLAAGIDNGYYAQSRVFTVGLNMSFNK